MRALTDGLLFHPGGTTAADVLNRMADGTTNYNLDDPFKPALDETLDELDDVRRKIQETRARLAGLESAEDRLTARYKEQQAAKDRFAETGEIDPVLLPSVEALAEAEEAKQREEIKSAEAEEFVLSDDLKEAGWKADKTLRVTDTEIIVTIRKKRTDAPVDVEGVKKRIAKVVENAMQPFCVDDSRYRRVLRERIARRPQQPKGPPDD
ncbi:hypothetical protein [Ponticoccus alexandrii]|uniref:Uncharacterized protein n=1 Tax=Ponticoccus alexandrii TaxID=1943633 RepID=A0ABX7FAZ1_9RHOB|nr:hypothetical protein [Ponticoccus alexandrii]ETA53860.1 hypothetical protein P279_01045 [Rhodobacteraceae bacterium PD-2]QRF67274.1 hypothetical protein GQA70_13725 [Ponticoccus alexandrii]